MEGIKRKPNCRLVQDWSGKLGRLVCRRLSRSDAILISNQIAKDSFFVVFRIPFAMSFISDLGGAGGRPRRSKDRKQPYVLFCQERAELDPALRGKSLAKLVEACSDDWKNMGFRDKQKYVDMAREYNDGPGYPGAEPPPTDGDWRGRFDCYGRSMVALRQKELLDKYDKAVMERDVTQRVERAVRDGSIVHARFHVLNVNLWCETKEGQEGRLIPAEIGLAESTLHGGLGHVLHAMVDPGTPPRGYKGEMKAMSDKYHKIWTDNEDLTDDYLKVMESITQMLRVRPGEARAGQDVVPPHQGFESLAEAVLLREREEASAGEDKRAFLPVYCLPKQERICRGALKWLQSRADTEYRFKLYGLHHLFLQLLRSSPAQQQGFGAVPTLNIAEANLSRDFYQYVSGMACRFHERVECPWCAAAASTRQSFVVFDFCCRMYGVAAVEGRHVPWGVKPPRDLSSSGGSDTGDSESVGSAAGPVARRPTGIDVDVFQTAERRAGEGEQRRMRKHPLDGLTEQLSTRSFAVALSPDLFTQLAEGDANDGDDGDPLDEFAEGRKDVAGANMALVPIPPRAFDSSFAEQRNNLARFIGEGGDFNSSAFAESEIRSSHDGTDSVTDGTGRLKTADYESVEC